MISFNDLHSENAYSPIDLIEDEILICVSEKHLQNAYFIIF